MRNVLEESLVDTFFRALGRFIKREFKVIFVAKNSNCLFQGSEIACAIQERLMLS